jgi:hypothetical protein
LYFLVFVQKIEMLLQHQTINIPQTSKHRHQMETYCVSHRANINRNKQINRKSDKASKYINQEFWKRARNVRFQKQSRDENFVGISQCDDEPIPVLAHNTMLDAAHNTMLDAALADILCDWMSGDRFSEINIQCVQDAVHASNLVECLSKCMCCKRHQIDRPTSYVPRSFRIPKPQHEQSGPCSCHCRHISRAICRRLNDNIYVS